MKSAWGSDETQYFFELTPESALEAVEEAGYRPTGRAYPLNSFENRVYEVEIEPPASDDPDSLTPMALRRVVKFYRPGRWSKEQILEEHEFLKELVEAEVPVLAPEPFADLSTLKLAPGTKIWHTVWPKIGGRTPDELDDEKLEWVGRTLARLHTVGALHPSKHRVTLNQDTYGRANLEYLLKNNWLPANLKSSYADVVESLCALMAPFFKNLRPQRVHGDAHLGNLLWNHHGLVMLDFDDMVMGPVAQDLWLMLPGRDEEGYRKLEVLLYGYEQVKDFPREQIPWMEGLRALRFVHFAAWLARRWQDPAFPPAFPHFNTERYWGEQVRDLQEQLLWLRERLGA